MKGIQSSPAPTSITVVTRPTNTSRASVAFGRHLRYTSHVSRVEQELKAEASELISAASGFLYVARCQHALHDVLVGTPVPNAEDRRSENNSRPGEILVMHWLPHREKVGRHTGMKP